MIDQFGRRPKRANNPETMGLVRIVYPPIETAAIPETITEIFRQLQWTEQDWKDFLKICLDYYIRENRHIVVPPNSKRFRTQAFVNSEIYPSNSTQNKKWPTLNLNNNDSVKNPNRLVTLLLLAMGIKKEDEITRTHQTFIKTILEATWNFLRLNILESNPEREGGFRLNLLGNKVAYEIIEKAWICPVNQVPLDTIFRGYSPMVTSRISSNLQKYRITEPPIEYPYFPYAYNRDNNHDSVANETILKWIDNNIQGIKDVGLWSNLHERILLNNPIYLSAEHTAQQNKEALQDIERAFDEHKLNILSCSTTMEMGVDISGISEVVMNNVPPKPANYLQRAGRAGRGSETKAMALTFCAPGPVGAGVFKNQKWAMTHKTAVPMVSFDSGILVQRHVNSYLLSSYVATDGANDITVSSSVKNFFYPEAGGINHYQKYLEYLNGLKNDRLKQNGYLTLVYDTCKHSIPFKESIAESYSKLEDISKHLEERVNMLENKRKTLLDNNYNQDSPATKAIEAQLRHIKNQNILGFFAEQNYIPSAGIPTGIVEFNTYNINDYRNNHGANNDDYTEGNENHLGYQKNKPTLNLTQAISEYAPGNQIVLNETCYVSRGIIMKSQWDDARRVVFQHCPTCGYTRLGEGIEERCEDCDAHLHGIRNVAGTFTTLIEPAGFSVDFSEEGTRTINSQNRKNYTQPALLNMPAWDVTDEPSSAKMDIRLSHQSQNSEILYYNLGNGYGYAVCIECGRTLPDNISSDNEVNPNSELGHFLERHKPLTGGGANDGEFCQRNVKRNVLLGGRFQTDFVEIRFRDEKGDLVNDEETIYSLGVILTQKLAEKIGINAQELNFGVKQYRSYQSVFIFDTARGGAGYSSRFNDLKDDVIDAAAKALSDCKCEKACDNCLINRDSQWILDKLDRVKALEWLQLEIKSRNIVPSDVAALFPQSTVYSLTTDFSSEINKVLINPDLQEITFFIDNKIENWVPEKWQYFDKAKELRIRGKDVHLSFECPATELKNLSINQKTLLGEICLKFKMQTHTPAEKNIDYLLIAKYTGSGTVQYFSEKGKVVNKLDATWGQSSNAIYRVNADDLLQYNDWFPDFSYSKNDDKEIMMYFHITEQFSTSCSLANILRGYYSEKWDMIFRKIINSSVKISYSDVYLNTHLGCRLLYDKRNCRYSKIKHNEYYTSFIK